MILRDLFNPTEKILDKFSFHRHFNRFASEDQAATKITGNIFAPTNVFTMHGEHVTKECFSLPQ